MWNNSRIGSISVEMLAAIIIAVVIALVALTIITNNTDKGSSIIDSFIGFLKR